MINVDTYFKIDGKFVSVGEFEGDFPSSFFDEGVLYVEGAIDLVVNGVSIIDIDMWDYVDQLWSYILAGLCSISVGQSYETYFPDQPLRMEFEKVNNFLTKVTTYPSGGTRTQVVETKEFVLGMTRGAEFFFSRLKLIAGGAALGNELEVIEAIKSGRVDKIKEFVD